MIPSTLDDAAAPGERQVFSWLAACPDTWLSIYSLDLAPWHNLLRTEIDFLVVVPDIGLLCLEVKSHPAITFRNDRWEPPSLKRSPFKQAADGRYAFRRRLTDLAPHLRHVPVAHCCIFTHSAFDVPLNLSVRPYELIDGRSFQSIRTAADFADLLSAALRQSIEADPQLQPLREPLTVGQVDAILHMCEPVQRNRAYQREEIERRARELERLLREQQKPALMLADLNERLIVSGPAGTGKTLIAMEVAVRAAEKNQRVALVCYNRLVGDWLKQQVEARSALFPNVVVERAFRLLATMAEVQIPHEPSPEFWTNELLEVAENRLTDPDFRAAAEFDYLVVDEAQDLLARPRLWNCLTQCLVGGPDRGRYALFGDFDHQVVGDRSAMRQTLNALEELGRPARWHLTENCRNYRIVGETAVRLSGFTSPTYTGYLRTGGYVQDFDIHFYQNDQEQVEVLRQWLNAFRDARYHTSEVVVLSFCTPEACAAATLRRMGYGLIDAWSTKRGVRYTSIHSFKGLEAKVVILTDVHLSGQEFQRDLFYTGMTRATEAVRILCSRESQEQLTTWLSHV
jgi:hypothetical protein